MTHCATRLRLELNNVTFIKDDNFWMSTFKAHGVIRKGNSMQIIFGPKVITLFSELEKYRENN